MSVTAVVAASTFAVVALTRPDGSASAEEAVEHLFDAIEQEDAIGVMESLPPGEREVLLDPMVATVGELQRLGLLDSFALEDVPGADIEVEGLTLESTNLGPGVTKVRVTGGAITGTVIPDEVPIGPRTSELAEREGETIDIRPDSSTESLADSDLELVAIEEDGGWHVSLFYTIAEYARGDDQPLPQFGSGAIAPIGADTPEGAVRGLVEAGLALDLGRAVGHLPPDEMRVLYDYLPLVLDDANEGADQARADGYTASLDRLDLHAEGDGDTRRVSIDAIDISGGADDTSMRYAWDGSCTIVELTEPGYERFVPVGPDGSIDEPEPGETSTTRMEACTDGRLTITEDGEEVDDDTYFGPFGGAMGSGPFGPISPFGTDATLGQAVTVVEHDGRWYVSPVRTTFDSMLAAIRGLEGADIDQFFDSFDSMLGTSAERFEDVEGTIEGPSGTIPSGTIPTPDGDDPFDVCWDEAYGNLPDDADDPQWDDASDAFDQCLIDHGVDPSPDTSSPTIPRIAGGHVLVPIDDEIVGYDLDGAVAFEGPPCESAYWPSTTVGRTSPVEVVLCDGEELLAIDGTNGAELWRRPIEQYSTPVVGPSAVMTIDDGTVALLDLRTGDELWSKDAIIVSNLSLDDTAAYIDDGRTVTAFELATGTERWSVPIDTRMLDTVPGGVIIRTDDDAFHRLDPATGATVWSSTPALEDASELVVVGITDQVVVVASGDGTHTIAALDRETGALLWSSDLVDEYITPAAGGTSVVVADYDSGDSTVLDHRTGEPRPDVELPSTAWSFDIEGDVLALVADTLDAEPSIHTVTLP